MTSTSHVMRYRYCDYSQDRERGIDDTQKTLLGKFMRYFLEASEKSIALRVGVRANGFDDGGGAKNRPFREVVGSLMCLSTLTHRGI